MPFPNFYNRRKGKFYEAQADKLICEDESHPIIGNIPRFVASGSYASLFGDQWKEYKKTQLDSYSGVPLSANRLNRCLGPLENGLDGKYVLEAGCGAGRFTEVLLHKKANLVSSDLSSAVEVNAENFPISDKHIVIQADINDMPYADESFDVVVCLGVIQHTPDTEQTISDLYKLVKKGGSLVIDHYTFSPSFWLRLAPFYRRRLKQMTASETIPATQRLINRFLPLHKKFAGNKILSVLLNRISPVVSYYRSIPQLNEQQQREWALLDTHDSLTDFHKRFRNTKQIRATLQKLGGTDIWCACGGNGVEARCKKPL